MSNRTIHLLPHVTVADVRLAARELDVPDFVQRMRPFITCFDHVDGSDPDVAIVRAVADVDLPEEGSFAEVFAPYRAAGIDGRWLQIVKRIAIRGWASSARLAHRDAQMSARYVVSRPGYLESRPLPYDRKLTLSPSARTLGLTLQRTTGGPHLARTPRVIKGARFNEVDELAEVIAERVELTPGGRAYLAPERRPRALGVLAATVRAVLETSATRWHGEIKVVRADVYEAVFAALGLAEFFGAARRFLEHGHPDALRIVGPWPPSSGAPERELSILEYQRGFLVLRREARLGVF